jgi:hypothetical protein
MTMRYRRLMQEVREAKPERPVSPEDWAKSERAEELLARLHVETEKAGQPEPKAKRRYIPPALWITASIVLLAVVVPLVVWQAGGLSGGKQTSDVTTETSVAAAAVQTISREDALGEVLALFQEFPGFTIGRASGAPGSTPDVLQDAATLGLVRGSEVSRKSIEQPTTRGEFALWIWRGWHLVLPESDTAVVADEGSLGAEELRAVRAIVSLGIMQLDDSSAFRGGNTMTSTEAANALVRLRTLLEERGAR